MKNNNLMMTGIIAVIVGGLAFFGGMKFQETQSTNTSAQNRGGFTRTPGQNGQSGATRTGGRGFGGAVVGEVLTQDSGSVTLKLQDGSSKIVNLAATTTYSKTDTGTKTDLKTGVRIAVFGTANSDGSVTAQNVQLNPMFRTETGRPSIAPAK